MLSAEDTTAPQPAPGPRLLTLDNLVPYLLEHQLVDARDVVDPAFEIYDYSRRNRNFKVVSPGGQGVLVKQAGNPLEADFRDKLGTEADLLHAVTMDKALKPMRWFSPRLLFFDPRDLVVVTELIHPATSITKYHLNAGDIHFPEDSAETCGRILGRFHKFGGRAVGEGTLAHIPSRTPFIWDLFHHADRLGSELGPGMAAVWRVVKEKAGFWERVPDAREAWARHDGLVHMDVRWDNFLLTYGSGPGGNLNLRLIDWELAGRGDPAWDVSCFLAEYVRYWLSFLQLRPDESLDNFETKQRYPFSMSYGSSRLFWKTYARHAGLRKAEQEAYLDRIRAYLPFNLVLIAAEGVQRASTMTGQSRAALELALRADARPGECIREWFGLLSPGGRDS